MPSIIIVPHFPASGMFDDVAVRYRPKSHRVLDQRLILKYLREGEYAGIVIHGIGGSGKSSLAAQMFRRLAEDG